jgi:putative transposase
MSSHVYHEILLHLNWHTKESYPMLTPELEEMAYAVIRRKCQALPGVHLHLIGGTENHVHLAVAIEPHVTISDLVQELKGASSYEVNQRLARKALLWQRGYGAVSFGQAQLPWVLDYITHQREHHTVGRVHDRLERCEPRVDRNAKPAGSRLQGGERNE